jgi:FkbM family methyltransferase
MFLNFLEIGAYKGDTAARILELDDSPNIQIHCFEPNPLTYNELLTRFYGEHRVGTFNLAISNFTGSAPLYWHENVETGSTLHGAKKSHIGAPSIRVEVLDIRDLIRGIGSEPIVLYCNCEGSEFEIVPALLESGLWRKIDVWSVDFHYQNRAIPTLKPEAMKLKVELEKRGIQNRVVHLPRKGRTKRHFDAWYNEHVRPLIP